MWNALDNRQFSRYYENLSLDQIWVHNVFYVPWTVPVIDADEVTALVDDGGMWQMSEMVTQDDLYRMIEDMEPAPLHNDMNRFDEDNEV